VLLAVALRDGVAVTVAVAVDVRVAVLVRVGVFVGVCVCVDVGVRVGVLVALRVGVLVGVVVGVGVRRRECRVVATASRQRNRRGARKALVGVGRTTANARPEAAGDGKRRRSSFRVIDWRCRQRQLPPLLPPPPYGDHANVCAADLRHCDHGAREQGAQPDGCTRGWSHARSPVPTGAAPASLRPGVALIRS
jgi:hypothetical protein